MSLFISYNHKDDEFVTKLSNELVNNNIPVWRDKQQMKLGDSITNTIQDALEKASFVCLILSKNSIQSKWVEREITASLVRELEEKKLSILPCLIDDCNIPLFLRDKLYVDFRKGFDKGVNMIINAVADKYNLFSGKFFNEKKTTSFGTDIVVYENQIEINLDIISEDKETDYFILTKTKLIGNKNVKEQFVLYQKKRQERKFLQEVISICSNLPEIKRKKIVIGGKQVAKEDFFFENKEHNLIFNIKTESKKIGIDNGKYVIFYLGALFDFFKE